MRPEVFISHTSRKRDASELRPGDSLNAHRHRKTYLAALRDNLADELGRRGLDVWLDRRAVEPSDEFQPILALGLARCSTAVLLVDRDALDSAFMRDEAVFLGWRAAAEPGFRVLPVLLGDVTELEWNGSQLGAAGEARRLSVLRLPRKVNFRVAAEHAVLIADAIPPEPHNDDPVARRWIEEMEHFFGLVPAFAQARAAEALGIERDTWDSLKRGPRILAAAMLYATLTKGTAAFRQVRDFLPAGARRQVGKRIIPLWVDLSIAGSVMSSAQSGKFGTVGLGAGSLELANHAVLRGSAHRPGMHVPRLAPVAGENFTADLIAEYDATIRACVGLEPEHTPAEIKRWLDEDAVVVFVLIDTREAPGRAINTIVSALVKRFPGFVIGLVAPPSHPSWRSIRGSKHVLTKSAEDDRFTRLRVNQIRVLMEDNDD